MIREDVVGLISCCQGKCDVASRACDLYTSPLFRASRRFIETNCSRWAILSAKYGVVTPGRVIRPYDLSLFDLDEIKRRDWARRVDRQLKRHFPDAKKYIVLAGRIYRRRLLVPHIAPMAGLSIGQQLRWLNMALASEGVAA